MKKKRTSFGVNPERIDRLLALGAGGPEGATQAGLTSALDFFAEAPGQWIGRYRLLHVLGEGGMGIVYLAEQRQPIHRRVALKIIKVGMDTQQVIARFEAERQALALMDHPSIARVLDAGATENGRPYFVMERVQGIPITQYCYQKKLDTVSRLRLFVPVCQAIQHAHQKGIIHRDIKPSNILVTLQDGHPVPKVIDFGIAKATHQDFTEKTVLTQLSQFMGTPAYMSPEQVEMSQLDIDTRSDIYSLGVLLYELLTGTTPFDGEALLMSGFDRMRHTIQQQDPIKPSTRLTQRPSQPNTEYRTPNTDIATDLDWIVMTCLEKDRARRYETANGLAMDLQRHLNDETVLARPPSLMYRLHKTFRRNRLLCTAAALVAAALLIGIAVSLWQAARAREAEHEQSRLRQAAQTLQQSETELRRLAEETSATLREHLYVSEMYAAQEAFREGRIARARALLDRQSEDAARSLRGFEWRWLWAHTRPTESHVLPLGAYRFVTAVDYSPDGRRFLTLDDSQLQIWDTVTREPIASHDHPFGYRAAHAPDGKLIVSTETHTRAVRISDGETGSLRARLVGHTQPVLSATINGEGTLVASAAGIPYSHRDGEVFLWDVSSQERLATLPVTDTGFMTDVAFSPDGHLLAAGCGIGHVLLWDVPTQKPLGRLTGHRQAVTALRFTLDGRRLVTVSLDRTVRLWDTTAQREISLLGLLAKGGAFNVAISPDGRWAATSGYDHTVKIWDLDDPGEIATLRGHGGRVVGVAFHPEGNTLATTGLDGFVRFWDLANQSDEWRLEGMHGACFGFSEKSPPLLGIESGGHIDLWNVSTRERVLHSEGNNPAWMPGGAAIVFVRDQALIEWDRAEQAERVIATLGEVHDGIRGLASSPDGKILAWAEGNEVRVWHRIECREIARRSNGQQQAEQITFTSDGKSMATCGENSQEVHVWNTSNWQRTHQLSGNRLGIHAIAFSPDGQSLASAGADQTARVWDLASGEQAILESDEGALHALVFAPDGRTLALGTFEGSVQLWSLATLQQVASFTAGASVVYSVAFAPDGSALASTTMDGMVRVWAAPTWEQIAAGISRNTASTGD